jgi:hypothetical protein
MVGWRHCGENRAEITGLTKCFGPVFGHFRQLAAVNLPSQHHGSDGGARSCRQARRKNTLNYGDLRSRLGACGNAEVHRSLQQVSVAVRDEFRTPSCAAEIIFLLAAEMRPRGRLDPKPGVGLPGHRGLHVPPVPAPCSSSAVPAIDLPFLTRGHQPLQRCAIGY